MKNEFTKHIVMDNNESLACGVFEQNDGSFIAMTFTKSKPFKTRKGAEKWLERNGGYEDEE